MLNSVKIEGVVEKIHSSLKAQKLRVRNEENNKFKTWISAVAFQSELLPVNEGDRVMITGRLSGSSWTDKNNSKRYDISIIISKVDVLRGEGAVYSNKNPAQLTTEEMPQFNDEDVPF